MTIADIKTLKWEDKQNVNYCIPTYLRNEQIRINMRLVKDRLAPTAAGITYNPEPCAVVAFGPSLKDTFEKVKEFKTIISCSGSHKFLIERGIIPTYHVEVDPRVHKIVLLGEPHPDVQYLPCSAVHPDYLRHLIKYNAKVTLWHVFGCEDASQRVIPKGEWLLTGGCDAGLRSMTIARFLGFTNLHLFGFDGSAPEKGGARHAAFHPNPSKAISEVEYGGRTFYTTPAMLEAAKGLFHELEQLPDVMPTFYGDGLIQHRAKTWERQNHSPTIIAAIQSPLISDEMLARHRELHLSNPCYGGDGARWVRVVRDLVENTKKEKGLPSVLDYGCGKGFLAEELDFPIWEYDPAIPGKERLPKPSDIVICTDTLEHIEPENLDAVLDDLRRVTRKIGVFSICTRPAYKTFPDGTNAHLIVMPKTWWQIKLSEYFEVGKTIDGGSGRLIFVLGPQTKPKKMVAKTIKVGHNGKLDKKSHKLVLEKLVNENNWTIGAEVGCLKGSTTFHLLKNCPALTLYAIDAWKEYDGLYADIKDGGQTALGRLPNDGTETRVQVPFEVVEELFRDKAAQYNGRLKILKGLSWEMANQVEDQTLDFAFIDADHIEPAVRRDIQAWRPKVKRGGMLLGHDVHLPSVRKAVDDLCPGWNRLEQEVWATHI